MRPSPGDMQLSAHGLANGLQDCKIAFTVKAQQLDALATVAQPESGETRHTRPRALQASFAVAKYVPVNNHERDCAPS